MEEVYKYKNNINIKTVIWELYFALQIKTVEPDIFISANNEWMNYLEEKLILKNIELIFIQLCNRTTNQ